MVTKRHSPKGMGFTLIELMVVILIIAILVGAVVAIGSQVKAAAARKSTLATLKTLDGIMKDYLAAGNPEPQAPLTTAWPYGVPASGSPVKGYSTNLGAQTSINPPPPDAYMPTGTAGVGYETTVSPNASDPINWVMALQSSSEFSKKLNSLPHGFDITTLVPNTQTTWPYQTNRATGVGTRTVILDAWGAPIRYVSSQGVSPTINGPPAKSGYFVSAGPDGQFFNAIWNNPKKNDDILSSDAQ